MVKLMKTVALSLSLVMCLGAVPANAASSPTKTNIGNKKGSVSVVYNYKNQPLKKVKIDGQTLVAGKDFVIVGNQKTKNSKTYTIKIKGIGKFNGTATVKYTIKKHKNNLRLKNKKKAKVVLKAKTLKKKSYSYKIGAKALTKKFYSVKGNSYAKKHIKVSKNGKVTVKKGTKKGTYKIQIKARETLNHKSQKKTIKVVVK